MTLTVLHVGAVAILFLIDIPIWLGVVVAVGLFASLYRTTMLYVLRRSDSAVVALQLLSDDELLLRTPKSKSWRGASIRARFVHPKLVLLHAYRTGRRVPDAIVIAADAIDREAFRRLRARLLVPPRKPEE